MASAVVLCMYQEGTCLYEFVLIQLEITYILHTVVVATETTVSQAKAGSGYIYLFPSRKKKRKEIGLWAINKMLGLSQRKS